MSWTDPAIVLAAVAAAVNAGAFFAFSNFVMPALADLPPAEGTAAMQSINRFAPTPLFVGSIFGAVAIGVPALVFTWGSWSDGSFRWLAVGVASSLVSLLITIACNVPRNEALDRLDPSAESTERHWARYVSSWTRWNTARTIASAVSVVAYLMAVRGR